MTSAGIIYFITEVAFMRGLRSAGIDALLLGARLFLRVTILHTVDMTHRSLHCLSSGYTLED